MKKLSTAQLILTIASAVLGVTAFVMMFTPQAYLSDRVIEDVLFGNDNGAKGAVGAFIGYLLAGLGGLAILIVTLLDVKCAKYIVYGCAGLMLVGAILVFCVVAMYKGANPDVTGMVSYVAEIKIGAGPVFGGIFGVLGGAAGVATTLVK